MPDGTYQMIDGEVGTPPPADDLLSDESSFYGDEEVKASYERRVASFDPKHFWEIQKWNVQCIAARGKAEAQRNPGPTNRPARFEDQGVSETDHEAKTKSKAEQHNTVEEQNDASNMQMDLDIPRGPYNPYEGNRMAKQLGESLEEFFKRLPPSETTDESGPWIFVANVESQSLRQPIDVGGFKQAGFKIMDQFLERQRKVEEQNPTKHTQSIYHMLQADRIDLGESIKKLALSKMVRTGKWMIFPPPHAVDEVWETVARNTLEGRLGCSAKVATRPSNDDSDGAEEEINPTARLVCIYTDDFSNVEDVKRVLEAMRVLGLVKDSRQAKPIYYKCDAYSYLDIKSGNEFKLKASTYSSRDLFRDMAGRKV